MRIALNMLFKHSAIYHYAWAEVPDGITIRIDQDRDLAFGYDLVGECCMGRWTTRRAIMPSMLMLPL